LSTYSAHDDLKEQVRTAVDIVDLVGSYLELRRQGRNYVALCPWHSDTKPSLNINPVRQSWKCWVCDDGGDIFSFMMKREGVGFREALELLAEKANIEVRRDNKPSPQGSASHKPTLFRVMEWAEKRFHDCLLNDAVAEPARAYLRDRGVSEENWGKFHLGFAPGGWQWLSDQARTTTYGNDLLMAAGLLIHNEEKKRTYDRFRERVMFSIRDPQNRPIACGGRVLPGSDDGAKYINSPETRLFSKSDNLYALDIARDRIVADRHAIVVEGYTDVIMLHQHGVDNAVAALGTALGQRHVKVLRRFADRVTLVLDGDDAGQRRSNEVLEMFVASPIDLRIVTLPEGQDPCDFVQKHGADAFRAIVADAEDALSYKLRLSTQGLDSSSDLHRVNQALEEILKTLAGVQVTRLGDDNPWQLRMEQILARLSRDFHIEAGQLRTRMKSLRRAKRPISETNELSAPVEPLPKLQPWDRELLWLLFQHPEFVEEAMRRLETRQLATDEARMIWQLLCDAQQSGQVPDFNRILGEVEDPRLKNLMVEIDEAQIRSPQEPQECLEQLIEAYHAREQKGLSRQRVTALEASNLSEEDQIAALSDILNQQRKRQGI